MQILLNNWAMIAGSLIFLAVIAKLAYDFYKRPTAEQIANVKEWLLWAVTEAERILGGGTGVLKLRFVYDLAVERFPWISKLIPFETFSGWVDEVLEKMKKELASNAKMREIITGN